MPKRPRFTLLFIILITLAAIFINLPLINIKGREISHPQINTSIFKRDLEPKLGLDLAGGVQLTMSADMTNVPQEDRDNALESAKDIVENRINALGVAEPVVQASKSNDKYRLIVEIAGISDIDQAISIVKKTAQLEFKTVKDVPPEATAQAIEPTFESTNLTGADLKRASAAPSQDPKDPGYIVNLEFNEEGAKKFEEITKANMGKPVAMFLDNEIISAPVVQGVISDGNAQVTGNFTSQEAKQLAVALNAGALPVPLVIESQTRVGPTLGASYIEKSLVAAAIGIASVSLFMVFYYGFLGVFATVALIIYTLITFAVFKLIPVTLTLAGIAGFILSVGMAVDANILIFERIKEERRWGKAKSEALYTGFNRAWSSIRDSNVSSLITTAILFNFGTGSIRGFALTLALGILVSMFSAITVTRTLLRVFWVRQK
ncbi:MAG: protein translocase subunit SecD [Candidatus Curtissbacteria bacterium]|nr:protein translocase subunit SecD [Candidatus Curtissbacteria bacterium]